MFRRVSSVSYFRNFIFGATDSLVSTVGLLSGIAVAGVPKEIIFLTGIVLIFVEAFSMGAGSFLSETSAEGYASSAHEPLGSTLLSGAVMFISYFISGFIPLAAYLIWPVGRALTFSIIFSLVALFVLGLIGGRMSHTSFVVSSVRMVVIGGAAIALGFTAGFVLSSLLGVV